MKTALLTGCTSKLAPKILAILKCCGFKVVGQYSSQQDVAQSLVEKGLIDKLIQVDFCEMSAENLIFDEGIDLIINNASIFLSDTGDNFELGMLDQHLRINSIIPLKIMQTSCKQNKVLRVLNFLDAMLYRQSERYFSYYISKKMLEVGSQLMENTAPNLIVKNIYLPDMSKEVEQSRVWLAVENFVRF